MARDANASPTWQPVQTSQPATENVSEHGTSDHEARPGDKKKPRLLIMDRTPLSVLSYLDGALDWLFVPGCDVRMTAVVLIESGRPSEPSADPRSRARATLEKWLAAKKHLVQVVSTEMGKKHTDLMTLWEMAGRPEHLRPSTPNGDENPKPDGARQPPVSVVSFTRKKAGGRLWSCLDSCVLRPERWWRDLHDGIVEELLPGTARAPKALARAKMTAPTGSILTKYVIYILCFRGDPMRIFASSDLQRNPAEIRRRP
jgi:hypothetical protein